MRPLKFITVFILFTSCCDKQNTGGNTRTILTDTVYIHDTIIAADTRFWQEGFGLTHEPAKDTIWFKPVSYYIADKECSGLALAFYYGRLAPSDDEVTDKLLELAATDNQKLRPFYRWCLNKTILIQDGALAEHTGIPARKYAKKFPKEFFEYMDYDTTGDKYADWVNSILYSGFYDKNDYKKPQEIRKRMAETMKENCTNCNEQLKRRIEKFAADCFP
jgi:hypothetical protein